MGLLKTLSCVAVSLIFDTSKTYGKPIKGEIFGGDLAELGYVFVILVCVIIGIALYTSHKRRLTTIMGSIITPT